MIESEIKQALKITDKQQRYEFIYDVMCNYLDTEFREKNYCEFQDGKCIVNRKDKTGYKKGGCCYFYTYGLFSGKIRGREACKHLGEAQCNTSCISCKLYACQTACNKGAKFKILDFPNIKSIFNRKQIEVLEINHFRTKEQIISQLLKVEKSKMPFFLFWFLNRGRIKN